jgi:hypothetical protein
MAKHLVKCFYCGQTFDAASEPYTKPRANRYAHVACDQQANANKTQEEKDYEALVEYIKHLFGKPNPRVWKQVKEYKDVYNYTYSGMLKTLIWWFEINRGDLEKANGGIGIIPYVYDQALQYYYALYLAQIANEDKDIEHYKTRVREFFIEEPKATPRAPRLFKFEEEEE